MADYAILQSEIKQKDGFVALDFYNTLKSINSNTPELIPLCVPNKFGGECLQYVASDKIYFTVYPYAFGNNPGETKALAHRIERGDYLPESDFDKAAEILFSSLEAML